MSTKDFFECLGLRTETLGPETPPQLISPVLAMSHYYTRPT